MYSEMGVWPVRSAQLSKPSNNVMTPNKAVTVHEKRLPITSA
jgi:hypothetical protein